MRWFPRSWRTKFGAWGSQRWLLLSSLVSTSALGAGTFLIGRLNPPTVIGQYAAVIVASGILSSLILLRIDLILPTLRTVSALVAAVRLGIGVGLVSTSLVLISVVFAVSEGLLETYWLWLPLTSLLISLALVAAQAQARDRAYVRFGTRLMAQNIGTSGSQVGLSFTGQSPDLLLLGESLGRAAGIISARQSLLKLLAQKPQRASHRFTRRLQRAILRHQVLRVVPTVGSNLAADAIPILVTLATLGAYSAGIAAMAGRLAALPMAILSTSLFIRILGETSSRFRGDEQADTSSGPSQRSLVLLGLSIGISIMLAGPPSVTVLLGSAWNESAQVLRLIGLPVGVDIAWGLVSAEFQGERNWRMLRRYGVVRVVTVLTAGLLGVGLSLGVVPLVALMAFASAAVSAGFLLGASLSRWPGRMTKR